jgi:dephospho-CoA kinase
MTPLAVAVTGGVACGKSTVREVLVKNLQLPPEQVFDADTFVHGLLKQADVLQDIAAAFPQAIESGKLNRRILRELVFSSTPARRELEAILHPLVSREWRARLAACRESNRTFLAEIPLLYEVSAEEMFDRVIVVASTPSVQRDRLQNERGLPGEVALGLLAAQMPLQEKVDRADFVLWNDGSIEALRQQLDLLLPILRRP